MKRNIVIATLAAAALIGGAATAFAGSDDNDAPVRKSSVRVADRDDENDAREDATEAKATKLTVVQAADAAQKKTPGTVASIDLDEDAGNLTWGVDILGKDDKPHDLTVDAGNANVLGDHIDRDDDEAAVRDALKTAKVSATEAARSAASHGTVTSVDLDDDTTKAWEVEVVKNGKERDLNVDLQTGKVTQAPADTDSDDD